MAWVVFISVVTWASTESALLALIGRLKRARSRLRSDECVYVLFGFRLLLFRRMRLMRICVCVDMRYGMGMLGKMYMNAMDMEMEMELRGIVNITSGSQHYCDRSSVCFILCTSNYLRRTQSMFPVAASACPAYIWRLINQPNRNSNNRRLSVSSSSRGQTKLSRRMHRLRRHPNSMFEWKPSLSGPAQKPLDCQIQSLSSLKSNPQSPGRALLWLFGPTGKWILTLRVSGIPQVLGT